MTITGLKIKLDRPVDRDRPCCKNICIIGPGRGPHTGTLSCADCGQHRGWLSKSTATWLQTVINKFGAPTTPIVLRHASQFTHPGEKPPGTAGISFERKHDDKLSSSTANQ
jgi:hypothetical protein